MENQGNILEAAAAVAAVSAGIAAGEHWIVLLEGPPAVGQDMVGAGLAGEGIAGLNAEGTAAIGTALEVCR